MQRKKVQNLSAFAGDLLMGCLLAFLAFSFVARIGSMTDRSTFSSAHHLGQFADFHAYYTFGKLANSAEKNSLYDFDTQKRYFCAEASPGLPCEQFPYIPYLPYFAVLMQPFVHLPMNQAYVLWEVIGISLFVVSAILLARARSESPSKFAPYGVVLGTLASIPALRTIVLGQAEFLIAAGMAAFFFFWMTGRERLAGVAAALSVFKPQFVTFMLLPALVQKRWQILIAFAVTELVLFAVAIAYLTPSPVLDSLLAPQKVATLTSLWYTPFTMLCLRALYQYLPAVISTPLWIGTFLLGLGFLAWLWHRSPRLAGDEYSCWLVAFTILLSLLTSLYTQMYDAIFLLIPAVLTLPQAGARNLMAQGIVYKLWWALLYTFPLISWAAWLSLGRENPFTYHYFTLTILVCCVVAWLRLRQIPPAS